MLSKGTEANGVLSLEHGFWCQLPVVGRVQICGTPWPNLDKVSASFSERLCLVRFWHAMLSGWRILFPAGQNTFWWEDHFGGMIKPFKNGGNKHSPWLFCIGVRLDSQCFGVESPYVSAHV